MEKEIQKWLLKDVHDYINRKELVVNMLKELFNGENAPSINDYFKITQTEL